MGHVSDSYRAGQRSAERPWSKPFNHSDLMQNNSWYAKGFDENDPSRQSEYERLVSALLKAINTVAARYDEKK